MLLFILTEWLTLKNWGHTLHPPRPSHKHPLAWAVSVTLSMPTFHDGTSLTSENWGSGSRAPAQTSSFYLASHQPKGKGKLRNTGLQQGLSQSATVTLRVMMTPGDQPVSHNGPLGSLKATVPTCSGPTQHTGRGAAHFPPSVQSETARGSRTCAVAAAKQEGNRSWLRQKVKWSLLTH